MSHLKKSICPCIDCITFMICKSQLNKNHGTLTTFNFLEKKCELLKDYILNKNLRDYYYYNTTNYLELVKLFELKKYQFP